MERPRRQYDDNNFDVKNCDLSRRLQVPVVTIGSIKSLLDLGILELLHVELIR